MAQIVKNLLAMQETQVQSLGREDLMEKGMATHSSILVLPHEKRGSKKYLTSLVAHTIKCLSTMRETWV